MASAGCVSKTRTTGSRPAFYFLASLVLADAKIKPNLFTSPYVCTLQGVRRQAGRLAGPDCPGQSQSLFITLLSRKNRDSIERLTSGTDILWKSPRNARAFLNRDHRITTLLFRNTRPMSAKKQPMTIAPQPWALLTSPNLTIYSKMSFIVNRAKCLLL